MNLLAPQTGVWIILWSDTTESGPWLGPDAEAEANAALPGESAVRAGQTDARGVPLATDGIVVEVARGICPGCGEQVELAARTVRNHTEVKRGEFGPTGGCGALLDATTG